MVFLGCLLMNRLFRWLLLDKYQELNQSQFQELARHHLHQQMALGTFMVWDLKSHLNPEQVFE
jgi:hypothetical protein